MVNKYCQAYVEESHKRVSSWGGVSEECNKRSVEEWLIQRQEAGTRQTRIQRRSVGTISSEQEDSGLESGNSSLNTG